MRTPSFTLSLARLAGWAATWTLLAAGVYAQQPESHFYDWAHRNAPYSNPAPAQHRAVQPFNPVGFVHKVQPFAPADISDYGNGPPRRVGFFGSYERLFWSISKPGTVDIGSEAAEAFFDMENSLDTSFIKSTEAWGNRWDVGYRDTDEYGWLVSFTDHLSQNQDCRIEDVQVLFNDPQGLLQATFVDRNGDGFDDDINGNSVYGADGQDIGTLDPGTPDQIIIGVGGAVQIIPGRPPVYRFPLDGIPDQAFVPPDAGDLVFPFPRFTNFYASNHTEINSVEVMRTYLAPRLHGGGNFELLYGVRYMVVDDNFFAVGTGGPLDESWWETKVANNIVGPQIGARWSQQRGRWVASIEGRFTAGANFQNLRQKSRIASQLIDPVFPSTLVAFASKDDRTDEQFSPIGELRLQTSYIVTRSVAIKLGYTVMGVGGIARASNRVDYTLPKLGILNQPQGDGLFVNGVSLGIEINR